jgi:hypothetical protein
MNVWGETSDLSPHNRFSLAHLDAVDLEFSTVAYWNGEAWEDVTPVTIKPGMFTESHPSERKHNQSRIDSFAEAVTNTAIGFVVSLITWIFVARAYGIPMTFLTNLSITAIFTVVSIVRQYVLRRIFDGRSPWQWIKGCFARFSTLR